MLKFEAEAYILRQFDVWCLRHVALGARPTAADERAFYDDLALNHPGLLSFAAVGDKRTRVHDILEKHGRVSAERGGPFMLSKLFDFAHRAARKS